MYRYSVKPDLTLDFTTQLPAGIASTNTTAYMTWTGIASPQPYNLEIEFATATP
jgi:hypothetical protein